MNSEDVRLTKMGRAILEAAGDDDVLKADFESIYERMRNPQPMPLCMDKECKWQATGAHYHKPDEMTPRGTRPGAVMGLFGTEVIAFVESRERSAAEHALHEVRDGLVARIDSPPANPKTWPSVVLGIIGKVLSGDR